MTDFEKTYQNYNPRQTALDEARALLTAAARAAMADGTLPEAGSDSDWWNMVYRWTDCPVLTGLDLGEYRADTTHAQGGDSQTYLADFYIGMRGAWNTGTEENLVGGEELWQALTAGAVSTVEVEG